MGIDLTNERGRYFGCSGTRWQVYRGVAERFGWQPAGTQPPEDAAGEEWSGSYERTQGERVTAADALALAAAIDRALAAPDFKQTLFSVWGLQPSDAEVEEHLEQFSRASLEELASFCRDGGFRVE